ncbi:MAG: CoA transferase [Syntrophaceae bacterium]|nr:CoA transferase [Syntrophaceae bacterium]
MGGALQGVRILDLTHAYNGPFCTMHLADHGAEILKIEKPGVGDMTREWPPIRNGESGYYAAINRNKKSISLDITKDRGKEIFKTLVRTADVVVNNFRPGTMDRLGLGYDVLKSINPRIILAEGSGFGQYGPLKDRAAYDVIAQAMGGLCDITGDADGPPMKPGTAIGDNYTGTYLALGICMALFNREKTGLGQCVDVAMLDTIFSILENAIPVLAVKGESLKRNGFIDPATSPYDLFPCRNGHVVIAAANNNTFNRLCEAMNRTDLIENGKFSNNDLRCTNREDLSVIIRAWTSGRDKEEIESCLTGKGVPVSSIYSVEEIARHPQIEAREMLVEIRHPVMGPLKVQGVPIKLSQTPGSVRTPSPILGEHTEEVLASVGIRPEEMPGMKEEGII